MQVGNQYRTAYARARGHRCFDHNYYVEQNPDLGAAFTRASDLWGHYAGFGQFENRPMRCDSCRAACMLAPTAPAAELFAARPPAWTLDPEAALRLWQVYVR